jgi:hypothetical protein
MQEVNEPARSQPPLQIAELSILLRDLPFQQGKAQLEG